MSVNYMIEINGLDDWELTHPLSATAYKVLRKLLYLANKERFPERIPVPNRLLMSMVGCSEDSLIKARNQLIQYGLITYKGQKKLTPLYGINYFSNNPVYNPKIQSYEQGIEQGYEQGIEQGYEQGIKQGTYINKTKGEERKREETQEEEEDGSTDNMQDGPAGAARLYTPRARRLTGAERSYRETLEQWMQGNLELKRTYGRSLAVIEAMLESDRYPLDLVGRAMEMTLQRNRRYAAPLGSPIAYTQTLLEDWEAQGYRTIEDLQEGKEDWALYG